MWTLAENSLTALIIALLIGILVAWWARKGQRRP